MPRTVDFTTGNETDWNEVRLPEPVYGEREIRKEELSALVKAFNAPVMGFDPQFSTYGVKGPEKPAESFDAAHAWLSANATGPWDWTEDWANHGHHLDVAVYVERTPDQLAFAAAFPDLFKYRPSGDFELGGLAVSRGVLPRLTGKESFSAWCRENAGFDTHEADDLGENGWRISFTDPEVERRFNEAWPDFTSEEFNSVRFYEGVVPPVRWDKSLSVWLDRNAAVGSLSGGRSDEGYRYKVEARYPKAADALERDWGHVFERGADGLSFTSPEYPSSPSRPLPADFLAYLAGEVEEYEAPHLPEAVRELRDGSESPAPRR